jgi:hypothetical protein
LVLLAGYRCYLPTALFTPSEDLLKPDGDPVISTFPIILDCPDVLESFIDIFNEDFVSKFKGARSLKEI